VINVALPSIQRDLGGGLTAQQWIVDAYLLTLGSLILVGGSLGDLYGERRIFALGVGGFGVASLLCALAPSSNLLIAARGVQGIAGALLTPSSLAVIVATFEGDERGAARDPEGGDGEYGGADDHADGERGDQQARLGDGDAEVGGDVGEQAGEHELGGALGEDRQAEERDGEGHGVCLSGMQCFG